MPPSVPRARAAAPLAVRAVLLALACGLCPRTAQSATPPADAKPVRSLMQLRDESLVRQQWDLSCGAAVVATLLTYQLGAPVSEREAALGMLRAGDARLVRARLGFSLLDLKRFAASRGFVAEGFGDLTLDELVAMAPAVAPTLVFGFGHFVIVRGRVGDRLIIGDPSFGNRTIEAQAFVAAWPSRIGFVIHPRDEPHPPNRMGAPVALLVTPARPALRAAEADLRLMGGLR